MIWKLLASHLFITNQEWCNLIYAWDTALLRYQRSLRTGMFRNAHGELVNSSGYSIVAVTPVDGDRWFVDVDVMNGSELVKQVRFTLVQHEFGRMKGSWMTKQLLDREWVKHWLTDRLAERLTFWYLLKLYLTIVTWFAGWFSSVIGRMPVTLTRHMQSDYFGACQSELKYMVEPHATYRTYCKGGLSESNFLKNFPTYYACSSLPAPHGILVAATLMGGGQCWALPPLAITNSPNIRTMIWKGNFFCFANTAMQTHDYTAKAMKCWKLKEKPETD